MYGLIYKNTPFGVFGIYQKQLPNKDLIEIVEPDEVKLGPASIYTVLMDEKVEAFDINIIKLNKQPSQKQKNILFEVIDDQLLSQTGGIVQGMSGSPIIQNNKLVGAVTHVIVDNSERAMEYL